MPESPLRLADTGPLGSKNLASSGGSGKPIPSAKAFTVSSTPSAKPIRPTEPRSEFCIRPMPNPALPSATEPETLARDKRLPSCSTAIPARPLPLAFTAPTAARASMESICAMLRPLPALPLDATSEKLAWLKALAN